MSGDKSRAYDPATGLLTSKTYNDGTSDVYACTTPSSSSQALTRPGVFINYTYNAAGQQTSSAAKRQRQRIDRHRFDGRL